MKSTDLVTSTKRAAANNLVPRKNLSMGDLFKQRDRAGKIYEHTGTRTKPPSEVKRGAKTYGTSPNGDTIVGFQSRIVKGDITTGEDGATVSFDGDKIVEHVGRVSLTLNLFD